MFNLPRQPEFTHSSPKAEERRTGYQQSMLPEAVINLLSMKQDHKEDRHHRCLGAAMVGLPVSYFDPKPSFARPSQRQGGRSAIEQTLSKAARVSPRRSCSKDTLAARHAQTRWFAMSPRRVRALMGLRLI